MNSDETLQLAASSTLSRSLRAKFRNFKGKIFVAVGPDSYEFSTSGAFILSHIDGTKTISEITDLLSERYTVEPEAALADALEFAAELVHLGIAECR